MTATTILQDAYKRVRDDLENPATVNLLDSLETVTLQALAAIDNITATIKDQPTLNVTLDNVVHIDTYSRKV